MRETPDAVRLRLLSLALLRQLRAGQEAVRRSVTRAAPQSGPDPSGSSSGRSSDTSSPPDTTSTPLGSSSSRDAPPRNPRNPRDLSAAPPARCPRQAARGHPRPRIEAWLRTRDSEHPQLSAAPGTWDPEHPQLSAASGIWDPEHPQLSEASDTWDPEHPQLLAGPGTWDPEHPQLSAGPGTWDSEHPQLSAASGTWDSEHPQLSEASGTRDPEHPQLSEASGSSGPRETQAGSSVPGQQSNRPQRVTFHQESLVPEKSWRLRPFLGYDWIAGTLDNKSTMSDQPDAFFSDLRQFREANQEECVASDSEPLFSSLPGSSEVDRDHECLYCYRVNRRLFLVPVDPSSPCRLCKVPRGQRGPESMAQPAQVRVSLPLSALDPPHRYRIHRRKSFDASNTLALPRHCLLGWDILPPKPERSSAPKSLDLWSSVPSEAQHRKLPAALPSCLALSDRVPHPTPTWSETQAPVPCARRLKP
ncbi:migration and invasion-inhibitory protein [Erinaceus europaeus]|uniref:Migration and invasion-inhibitory protein n=1 Tax=Erinaceus europaeus TaxID=9365 RepID=A0A1S3AD09_ERIEU|nr:migration and invasion-inhibitory protein [Erinaceus europaeus]